MGESVPVRCPDCLCEHQYAAPAYPCACGEPVSPPLNRFAEPAVVTHRVWDEDWVTVRCGACGRENQWPRPELDCPCGTVVRVPVAEATHAEADRRDGEPDAAPHHDRDAFPRPGRKPDTSPHADRGPAPSPSPEHEPPCSHPAFQPPLTIRTARDAVTVTALYLRWLGYRDIRRADQRPPSGIGLAGRGVLALVDPTVRPASPRDVECLWLTAMTESAGGVYFSLAEYGPEARERADELAVALFVLDLMGTPRPVNDPAHELIATRARTRA
ncbi:hypothetical protein ACFS5L_11840 [Streptomyces phyllanthi]|uniref:hypothetical protein n=1 Tax=Streptomyces phyllanthi TaxID=1803180 RepID=UPI0031E4F397